MFNVSSNVLPAAWEGKKEDVMGFRIGAVTDVSRQSRQQSSEEGKGEKNGGKDL